MCVCVCVCVCVCGHVRRISADTSNLFSHNFSRYRDALTAGALRRLQSEYILIHVYKETFQISSSWPPQIYNWMKSRSERETVRGYKMTSIRKRDADNMWTSLHWSSGHSHSHLPRLLLPSLATSIENKITKFIEEMSAAQSAWPSDSSVNSPLKTEPLCGTESRTGSIFTDSDYVTSSKATEFGGGSGSQSQPSRASTWLETSNPGNILSLYVLDLLANDLSWYWLLIIQETDHWNWWQRQDATSEPKCCIFKCIYFIRHKQTEYQ